MIRTRINAVLTASQQDEFFRLGYLHLPAMVPAPLLDRLKQLFEDLMDLDKDLDERTVYEYKGKNYVTNLENVCRKGNLAALELLGYPKILEIAQLICGDDFFLIQEFAVNKTLGDELPVLWHKDMPHERMGRCFTMGIYLDDADENDGALRVVPGSHISHKGICELSKEPFIEVPVKAGDILIHDMLLAHSSAPLQRNSIRRVLYFEFLSAAHVKAENIYSDELVKRRSRLLYTATRLYASLHPEEKQFVHPKENPELEDKFKEIETILKEIYCQPTRARPSEYCLNHLGQAPELFKAPLL